MNEGYDVAQVCPNGHVTNSSTINCPEYNKEYCEQCGEKNITACPKCQAPIRGLYWGGTLSISPYELPPYCHKCGTALPWTDRKIQAAIELALEVEGLSGDDADQFKESVNDITRDTPKAQVSAHRLVKFLKKMGAQTAQTIRELFVDIASETAKKIIKGE